VRALAGRDLWLSFSLLFWLYKPVHARNFVVSILAGHVGKRSSDLVVFTGSHIIILIMLSCTLSVIMGVMRV